MSEILCPDEWRDYELMDSGDGMKLEKWSGYVAIRPEPRAIWNKNSPEIWKTADAEYGTDGWKYGSMPPEMWKVGYKNLLFRLKTADFKHTGVFPEQAVNWEFIRKMIGGNKTEIKVLNLFAYTGGATMAAAASGAHVTHVDASRPAMMWASENCKLTKILPDKVRWIQEDALKFVQREQRRGVKYDAIIMDPPRFGRGANGEVWKLEDNLPKLVHESQKILSSSPLFFLINAYTADLSHLAVHYVLEDSLGSAARLESGELGIREANQRNRVLPAGIWARATFD